MKLQKSADMLAHLASLIGPLGSEMLESRSATERNLGHPNPDVRAAAIHLFTHKWADDTEVNGICEKALNQDKHPTVRGAALSGLGSHNSGTKDRRIGRILSAVIKNESEDTYVREAAYRALFLLSGKEAEFECGEDMLAALRDIRIPDGVDWQLVDSFLE
jgi:HEAT repeat protein